ncbi:hypothetical protein [Micromonospora sp. URMC 103]|uniref:hypothetical protein n=1 Tax=Micromonospora sp. URMC 103 TaxID=3423406 RepID=UPI003F1C62E0
MQDTVAVALVTSMSTLAAASITGLIGLWASRRQVASHLAAAREERAEQRATWTAQLRRDSYVGFLSACDQAYRRLDWNWQQENHDAILKARSETYQALRGLDEAYNIVLLEGPGGVAREAELVTRSIDDEYREQLRLITEAASESDDIPLNALYRGERRTAIEERTKRRDSFVEAAKAALNPTR